MNIYKNRLLPLALSLLFAATGAFAAAASEAPTISWVDDAVKPEAVFLCIHGLGLHKGTYEAFGKSMAKIGLPTYALDVRGFGEFKEHPGKGIDFDGALGDIKLELEEIHSKYPGLPVIILGESMGGAIALRATAMYPDLISGLISSVPAGDRFSDTGTEVKVGIHALLHGFNKPVNVGQGVVEHATKKEDLRKAWETDPLAKMKLSPAELMQFQAFMKQNFEAAKEIKKAPVLFIQGANDKLVRPAGTWKLCDSLATPNRQLVLSKSAEHLIFEEGQFSQDDLSFIEKWINKNVCKLAVLNPTKNTATAEKKSDDTAQATRAEAQPPAQHQGGASEKKSEEKITAKKSEPQKQTAQPQISYWIELSRQGKTYRCNNRSPFKSGDRIRFHVMSDTSGYAYVVMELGSTGKKAVLFPAPSAGREASNYLVAHNDYALPWLKFDNNPGTERVKLVFSKVKVALNQLNGAHTLTAYVSPDRSGSKDLVPTRMQLSWSDATPVMIPDDFSGASQLAQSKNSSLVNVSAPSESLAIDIALTHE